MLTSFQGDPLRSLWNDAIVPCRLDHVPECQPYPEDSRAKPGQIARFYILS
jgi:hypothetical protein